MSGDGWRHVFRALRGMSHAASDAPCQDACAAVPHAGAGGPVLALLLSDGAGSASRAEVASKPTCDTVAQEASRWLADGGSLDLIPGDRGGERDV